MTSDCGPNDNDGANTAVDEYHYSTYTVWEYPYGSIYNTYVTKDGAGKAYANDIRPLYYL